MSGQTIVVMMYVVGLGASCGCGGPSPTAPIEASQSVVPLFDDEYFGYVDSLLRNAYETIDIAMYLMQQGESGSRPRLLLGSLADAVDRGVVVRVLLDHSDWNGSLNDQNERSKCYLESHGVKVRFDHDWVTTHAKMIVIDGEIGIVGSTNWTTAALERNNEVSIFVTDKAVVDRLRNYFEDLWSEGRASLLMKGVVNDRNKDAWAWWPGDSGSDQDLCISSSQRGTLHSGISRVRS